MALRDRLRPLSIGGLARAEEIGEIANDLVGLGFDLLPLGLAVARRATG